MIHNYKKKLVLLGKSFAGFIGKKKKSNTGFSLFPLACLPKTFCESVIGENKQIKKKKNKNPNYLTHVNANNVGLGKALLSKGL